jgi:hypothetical protein
MELEIPNIKLSLSDNTLRSIVVWIWKEKPDIIRDVVCENCMEHIETVNYNCNKIENDKVRL